MCDFVNQNKLAFQVSRRRRRRRNGRGDFFLSSSAGLQA